MKTFFNIAVVVLIFAAVLAFGFVIYTLIR
jgi:hypothetical protein